MAGTEQESLSIIEIGEKLERSLDAFAESVGRNLDRLREEMHPGFAKLDQRFTTLIRRLESTHRAS